MKLEILQKQLKNIKKGTFIKIEYETTKETKKYTLVKHTTAVIRLGIRYSKIKENINKNIQPFPFGQPLENYENYLIQHFKDNEVKHYLKCFTTKHKTHTTYYLNGEERTRQELEEMNILKPSKPTQIYVLDINNIIKIGV